VIDRGESNIVTGNRIGTDAAGLVEDGNGASGILISDSSMNRIGGVRISERNIISGNREGISIQGETEGARGNVVQGNYIGTDLTGMQPIANLTDGIELAGQLGGVVEGNLIGGDDSANFALDDDGNTIDRDADGAFDARNIISGNADDGISVFGPKVTKNRIEGNWIGLAADGMTPLGNGFGVALSAPLGFTNAADAASDNTIGGKKIGRAHV